MSRDMQVILFGFGCVFSFFSYLLTAPALIYRLRVKKEKEAWLVWFLSPFTAALKIFILPPAWLLCGVLMIVICLVGGPVYFLFARPLERLAAFLAIKAAQLREALHSLEAFEKYYAGFIRFGEGLLLYRDVLPRVVADNLPERKISDERSRPPAGSIPGPGISNKVAGGLYIGASQMGPAGD